MRISIIVAMAQNRVIGNHNQLPWHLPADLKRFKEITLGKPVMMGRKTFLSIGKALVGRRNIVLSTDPDFVAQGCEVFSSIEEALSAVKDESEIMIIGGAQLYHELLPKADRLYLTLIHDHVEGDAFFPAWERSDWQEISRHDVSKSENNPFNYSFIILDRKCRLDLGENYSSG